jgi:Transposase DDE domain
MTDFYCGRSRKCFIVYSEKHVVQSHLRQYPILIPPFGLQKGGDKISKAGKFKSSKITALCNEQSQIQNFEIGNGGESDHKAVIPIIPSVPANGYITADRGFDSKKLRRMLRYKGSMPLIPRRQFPNSPLRRTPKPYIYKSRWQIEKAFSQTDQFRKLIVRQERNSNTYKQYWYLGFAWFELKKLTG